MFYLQFYSHVKIDFLSSLILLSYLGFATSAHLDLILEKILLGPLRCIDHFEFRLAFHRNLIATTHTLTLRHISFSLLILHLCCSLCWLESSASSSSRGGMIVSRRQKLLVCIYEFALAISSLLSTTTGSFLLLERCVIVLQHVLLPWREVWFGDTGLLRIAHTPFIVILLVLHLCQDVVLWHVTANGAGYLHNFLAGGEAARWAVWLVSTWHVDLVLGDLLDWLVCLPWRYWYVRYHLLVGSIGGRWWSHNSLRVSLSVRSEVRWTLASLHGWLGLVSWIDQLCLAGKARHHLLGLCLLQWHLLVCLWPIANVSHQCCLGWSLMIHLDILTFMALLCSKLSRIPLVWLIVGVDHSLWIVLW